MKRYFTLLLLLGALQFIAPAQVLAQEEEKSEQSDSDQKPDSKKKDKTYSDIITDEAKTDDGLFKVHLIGEKVYYEIPNDLLNVALLWISRISGRSEDLSPYINAGSKTNEQVVQWQRKGNKVLLRGISYNSVADESLPIYKSVQYNNFEPIIQAFKVETMNDDSTAVVIEVTSLFTKDVPTFSGLGSRLRTQYKVRSLDASRSFIDTVRSYPINIEVVHTQTFNASEPPANSDMNTITIQMNQSMIKLPENPMTPRLYDERVGWFTVRQYDYGSEALKSDLKTYIQRWRLEPKDPEAYLRGELVEPVKPIVYYLDPATPERWRPYFRQGVEDWQAAFEAAGFKNAIICKDPPTPEEDPEFSPEDARYSTVRYVATTTRNAVGPRVTDPRTGEIIESDIIWYHNHLRSYRNRYLLETGAANPKARTLDTPEEEIGEMMRRVISHEIGHALGLPHNMKASSAYPVDSLRSGDFSQQYGIATTIMDYARYNYVAQPGDENIRFVRQLGPYDLYSINWGYRWLPNIDEPEDEASTLKSWIKAKEGDPMYMFGSGYGRIDPNSQTENIGDDPVKASSYGLSNLKIVAKNLIDWTTTDGENYEDLEELYGELVVVWNRYIGHVVTNIGGVHQTLKTSDQDGTVYEPVPKATQRESMQWLLDHAFSKPDWLMRSEISRRIEYMGMVERIRGLQVRHLNSLLSTSRLQRMIENQAFEGNQTYTMLEMMQDLRKGIWAEMYRGQTTDLTRRNLQRAYLEQMEKLLTEEPESPRQRFDVSQSDVRPVVRAELQTLKNDIDKNRARAKDDLTRYHLQDAMTRIDKILEGKK
jgi:hypothetical protein